MLNNLLQNNQKWSESYLASDGEYFQNLSQGQSPEYLWIGCADSRVPAESLLGLEPGQLFVHRNVANQVKTDDDNAMSVLQYAVQVLKVQHIIVCGHSSCGGVAAAYEGAGDAHVKSWLTELRKTVQSNTDTLEAIADKDKRLAKLTELNVAKQVSNIANHDIIKSARASGQELSVHGFVFDIASGLLQDLNIEA